MGVLVLAPGRVVGEQPELSPPDPLVRGTVSNVLTLEDIDMLPGTLESPRLESILRGMKVGDVTLVGNVSGEGVDLGTSISFVDAPELFEVAHGSGQHGSRPGILWMAASNEHQEVVLKPFSLDDQWAYNKAHGRTGLQMLITEFGMAGAINRLSPDLGVRAIRPVGFWRYDGPENEAAEFSPAKLALLTAYEPDAFTVAYVIGRKDVNDDHKAMAFQRASMALAVLHASGLSHGDANLNNFMLPADGTVVLCDLASGLTKWQALDLKKAGYDDGFDWAKQIDIAELEGDIWQLAEDGMVSWSMADRLMALFKDTYVSTMRAVQEKGVISLGG